MTDIIIDLGKHLTIPAQPHTTIYLNSSNKESGHRPRDATYATQDNSGALLWWNAPIEQVKAARKKANSHKGLYPLIGLKRQVGMDYYYEGEQKMFANDWRTTVVTLNQFIGLEAAI